MPANAQNRIFSNMWLWRVDDAGLHCVSSSETDRMTDYLPPASASILTEGMIDTSHDGTLETACEVVFIEHHSRYPDMCGEWLLSNFKAGRRPLVMIERRTIDLAHMNLFLITACADYVFVAQEFPEHSFLFRNQPKMLLVLQIPIEEDETAVTGGVPMLTALERARERWLSEKDIIGSSTRFFAEKVSDRVILYSMGIGGSSIRRLRRAGLEWSRKDQVWTGDLRRVDVADVLSIIREDTPLTPSVIGFVPEWYCDLLRAGAARKEESAFGKEIWRPIFGNY